MSTFTCNHCSKNFSTKYSLKRHRDNIELTFIRDEISKKSEELEKLKIYTINLEKELEQQKKLYVEEIKRQAETSEARALKLENHILKENSKPKNITINNMAPWDLTPERVEQICEGYTPEHFMAGPEATYKFLLEKHLKDEQGKPKLLCTDVARRIFKGKEKDGSEFTDFGAARVKQQVIFPLKKAIVGTIKHLDEVDTNTLVNKKFSHWRVLEPTRLEKRLAGDLNGKLKQNL